MQEERVVAQEKILFVGQDQEKIYSRVRKLWPWKARPHIMLSCCALAVALFLFAVYLIKHNFHVDVEKEIAAEIAPVSFRFCGNQSNRGCLKGEECSLRRIRRLVNGMVARDDAWPWMAEVVRANKHYCGAVLISKNFAITAAHCLYHHGDRLYEDDLEIRLGDHKKLATSTKTQTLKVSHIHIHSAFELSSLKNDIALIQLASNINLTKSVWPICLSGLETETVNAVMIGWGKTSYNKHFSAYLRETSVPVVPYSKCKKANRGLYDDVYVDKNTHICVGYGKKRSEYGCKGDSGGPLMTQSRSGQWMVIGVMSWGEPKCSSLRTNSYTVFTNISPYMSWIESLLRTNR